MGKGKVVGLLFVMLIAGIAFGGVMGIFAVEELYYGTKEMVSLECFKLIDGEHYSVEAYDDVANAKLMINFAQSGGWNCHAY